ncbi:MAG: hypothetical protein QOH43_1009 [Solirubrobacteraceae bacterium]|jgi:hypothetical protein|nr:hypothetical protein [Solirubrobacteraceae bacterium]
MPPDPELIEDAVRHLASVDRPSASEGERVAAEWIAAALRDEGCEARVEAERAHGTYWWPLGTLTAIAGIAGAAGRRAPGLLAGAFAAAGIADDISGGRQWYRRSFLPRRTTHNVVAVCGDRDAERTVVLVAHHDAAHWSLIFHPGVTRWVGEHHPELLERTDTTPPVMWPVFGGPLLVAVGAALGVRRLQRFGALLALATAAAMAEIGSRDTVPGANDNLSGVATLLGVARSLREEPVEGLRVLLVSTGSEESFMEGMQAFGRRHFDSLPVDRTHVICIDTVGSPELIQLEGEGMLWMREYPAAFKDLVASCAQEAGVPLRRGLRFRNATDGLIALRRGYPTVMLGSVNRFKVPDNYHWPTDDADRVTYGSVVGAAALCEAVVRRLAAA